MAENDATGQVATKGPWAFGLVAETQNDGARTSAQARAVNRGRVTTEGRQAEGVLAIAHRGGTEANPNLASALNAAGARIETTGDETGGLAAAVVVGAGGTSFGTARAENAGTIMASGRAGVWDDNEPENKSAGMWAGFFNFTDEAIADSGDATVRNSGDVTVTGAGMTGLRALTYGAGTATVEMTGGTVTASAADDPATGDTDESGIGICAGTGATGTARVTVGGGRVRAPLAARLEGGTTRLTLANGAFLEGDVSFDAGADTLETAGYIGGDVSFGAGEDTLLFDVRGGIASIEGAITGIEDMIKRGTGTARVHDAAFAGSSLAVERDSLNVRGHIDLGADGTVTVEDAGRLTMEIGDIAANPTDHGRITAGGGIILKGADPAVFAAWDPALDEAQRTAAASVLRSGGAKLAGAGTRITTTGGDTPTALKTESGGEERTVGTLETTEDGTTAKLGEGSDLGVAPKSIPEESPTAEETEEPAPAAKDDDNEKTALAIGGGFFALALFDFFDLFDAMFGDEAPAAGGLAAWAPAPERAGEAGIVWWSQAMTGETPVPASAAGSLHGLRMDATARLGDGFHLGFSGMPRLAAGLDDSAFDGHRYALRGGWESDALFANADFSRGDYRARTTFANLDGLGSLSGAFGLRHERARAEMGARLELGGIRLDPALSLFTGSLDRAAYTATSAALAQRYDGWKARASRPTGRRACGCGRRTGRACCASRRPRPRKACRARSTPPVPP